ncbi:MAG: FxsA family protein [Pararhodobacter sp.]|nr:FxsA family protein [Pararhodobacter sp.]
MPVLLIFLLLILVEIALFVLVGGRIGLWPVLALTLLSIFAGLGVLKWQGARGAALARGGLGHVTPGRFLAQGAFSVLAGALLLLPGFFTDIVGLLLLLPPLQRLLMRALAARIGPQHPASAPGEAEIIEGSFRVDDDAGRQGPQHDGETRSPQRRRLDAPQHNHSGKHGRHGGH